MLETYYQFLPQLMIFTAGVCLIERKHLQLLCRVFFFWFFFECVIISGDPVLGFVIFNVLLSGCCGCQQWRKATESMFTQLSESWSTLFPLFPVCVPSPVHCIHPYTCNFGLWKQKVALWHNRTQKSYH